MVIRLSPIHFRGFAQSVISIDCMLLPAIGYSKVVDIRAQGHV